MLVAGLTMNSALGLDYKAGMGPAWLLITLDGSRSFSDSLDAPHMSTGTGNI